MDIRRQVLLGRAVLGDQRGITGLEAAIVLISFVVVASVFAFTVLSAGLFSAERGKETVHAGLQEARASAVVKGSVIAYKGDIDDDGTQGGSTTEGITRVRFALQDATAGEPMDLTPRLTNDSTACVDGDPGAGACYDGNKYTINTNNVVVIHYRDQTQRADNVHWEVTWLGKCQESPCDDLLEADETALITVWLNGQQDLDATTSTAFAYVNETQGGDTDSVHLGSPLGNKTTFSLEVVPPVGSIITVERYSTARLDTVIDLK